jgi:hypothetical protein
MVREGSASVGIRLFGTLFLIMALLPACTQAAGPGPAGYTPESAPDIVMDNNTIAVGIHLIDMYNFEYQTGRYTYDMYVFFFWTDPAITTADWYLRNGYPTYPGAKLLVEENKSGRVRWELYRVRASLSAPIEPTDYPFDRVTLPISIELLTHNYNTTLVWMTRETRIDPGFTNVGWSRPEYHLNTSVSHYPLGMDSPRADMVIIMDRNPLGAFLKTIFPPLVFCFVAAVCFLFRMHDSPAFTLRVGITTSMLVSAVLFNFAEQSVIPPVSQLTLFHVLMAATISFLALGLVVTVLGYVEWLRTSNRQYVDRLNQAGFLVSVIIPLLFFVLLYLVK